MPHVNVMPALKHLSHFILIEKEIRDSSKFFFSIGRIFSKLFHFMYLFFLSLPQNPYVLTHSGACFECLFCIFLLKIFRYIALLVPADCQAKIKPIQKFVEVKWNNSEWRLGRKKKLAFIFFQQVWKWKRGEGSALWL